MSNDWLKEWSQSKIDLASRLSFGECGGSYAEAVIIICNVLSAISADIWPGRNIDKKRFVELLFKYSNSTESCETISVPLLVATILESGDINLADRLKRELLPFSDTRIITGNDCDKTISDLNANYPEIEIAILKKHSYSCVLYEDIRSGYAHEYRPGGRADSWPMSSNRDKCLVSYINRLTDTGIVNRLIHFNVSWLTRLAGEVVDNLVKEEPLPTSAGYSSWWLKAT